MTDSATRVPATCKLAPLSANQTSQWVLYSSSQNSPAYHLSFLLETQDDFSPEIYKRVWQTMVKRHASLRTTFLQQDQQLLQCVHESGSHGLTLIDASTWSSQQLKTHVYQQTENPFDLVKGPLFRVVIYRLHDRHRILHCFHHVITDLWSFSIMIPEVGHIYHQIRSEAQDPVFTLEPVTKDVTDFVEWQQSYLNSKRAERDREYWHHHLANAPSHLPLPPDVHATSGTNKGARHAFEIGAKDFLFLKDLAHSFDSTLNMIVQCLFILFLYRQTGRRDIVMGTPATGRPRSLFDSVVGFFSDPLPLRFRIDPEETLSSLLPRVKQTLLQALRHQNYPFQKLVEEIASTRNSFTPVFNVMFVYYTTNRFKELSSLAMGKEDTIRWTDLSLDLIPLRVHHTQYDLSLYAGETEQGLSMAFDYRTERFSKETIKRFETHFKQIIAQCRSNKTQNLARLAGRFSPESRHVMKFSRTGQGHAFKSITELFQSVVQECPDRPAIQGHGPSLSFSQANRQIDRLALHLHTLLHPAGQTHIAVLLNRSEWLPLTMMAVFKIGAVYIPIDPHQPVERIRLVLHDCAATALITTQELIQDLEDLDIPCVCLDSVQLPKVENPPDPVLLHPQDTAYIIYTSGTTGRPKGVVQTHQCLSNLLQWQKHSTGTGLNMLFYASVAFDVSVQEMGYALTAGNTLWVVSDHLRVDFASLISFMVQKKIDLFIMPYSALHLLFKEPDVGRLAQCVRYIITSGETLILNDRLKEFLTRSDIVLYNQYGPTETHVITCQSISGADDLLEDYPSIGRPLHGCEVVILNESLDPVPVGIMGELYLGGDHLAKGYWQNDDLTRQRFIDHPFKKGERLYKSGDLGKWNADGSIRFMGRADDQVKINGFRVEPAEIENVLSQYPQVQQAAVCVCKTDTRPCLAAFYQADESLDHEDMFYYLSKHLPAYMIPQNLIHQNRLPKTLSGKIDKRALPVPTDLGTPDTQLPAEPRNEIEAQLQTIVKELLSHRPIGVFDNFFRMGGNSMTALKWVNNIQKTFQIDLPISFVFQYPTIAALAAKISALTDHPQFSLKPIPDRTDGLYHASAMQVRMWLLQQIVPEKSLYNMPGSFWVKGELNFTILRQSLKKLLERHEILRTVFQQQGQTILQKIIDIDADHWTDRILSQQTLPASRFEENARKQAKQHAHMHFDLEKGPLLQVKLITSEYTPRNHEPVSVLLFNAHHILLDGWSVEILVREWCAVYNHWPDNSGESLEPLPFTYKDFAAWHNEMLHSDLILKQKEYWTHRLQHLVPLNLPTDHPRPALQTFIGKHYGFTLADNTFDRLGQIAREKQTSVFTILLSAVTLLLHFYSNDTSIAIGVPSAGRETKATESMLGLFINTLVLVNEVDPQQSVNTLFDAVNDTLTQALENRWVPFDHLVTELGAAGDTSRSPLFDVMVNYMADPGQALNFRDAEIEPFVKHYGLSRFDLTIQFIESQGLQVDIEYNSHLYSETRIIRMGEHLQRLLVDMCTHPDKSVSALSFIPDPALSELLNDFNKPDSQDTPPTTLIDMFEQAALACPDHTAIRCEHTTLSYSDLLSMVKRLAAFLRDECDVKAEHPVAVIFDRNEWNVIAALAVMWTGGMYVPLEAANPPQRLLNMVRQSRCKVVLTQKTIEVDLPKSTRRIDLSSDLPLSDKEFIPNPHPSQAAYMIFTSGSTGVPKGVIVEHHGIGNTISCINKQLQISHTDRILQFFSFGFDGSLVDTFIALTTGATLVIPSRERLMEPDRLDALMRRHGVTIGIFAPSFIRLMGWERLAGLRHLGTAGEPALPKPDHTENDAQAYWNFYGPTECAVAATIHRVQPKECRQGLIPIGKPLENVECYILRQGKYLQPVGVYGEICIGGAGLGRGYDNDEKLTRERFVPHPFKPNERLYRSGDWGRWRPDGALEYGGRIDHQMKINGFRVEPGEIEAVLAKYPAVQQALVMIKPLNAKPELCAYLHLAEKTDQTRWLNTVKQDLKQTLPGYMIPSKFIFVNSFPVNKSGKIDRQRLPDPETTVFKPSGIKPRTADERFVANIFQEVLSIQPGLEDNFFDLGANSLKMVAIHQKLVKRFPQLTVVDMFQYPTIKDLVDYLHQKQKETNANVRDRQTRHQQRKDRLDKIRTHHRKN
ncbi:amino acid adenylation domain-containing protein [candidate division KSB1 bacterium]|nr:amino acid adenylation domain-containing protein [candidate division KSB1 bacterium]